MLLTKLYLKNFRCFEEITLSPLDELAIFIGENDAGKTVLLDAITLLVSNRACVGDDCRKQADDTVADEVVLEGTFRLDSHDTLPDEYRSGEGKMELSLKKRFVSGTTEIYVRGQGYDDERFDNFVGRDYQMDLLREYGVTPAGREDERKEQREQLENEGKLRHVEREIRLPQFSSIAQHMPRVDRVASYDYRNPESMVQRTLQSVAAGVVSPPNKEGTPTELDALQQVREQIAGRLNEEIAKAKVTLQSNHEKLEDVQVEPNIDLPSPSPLAPCI